MTFSLHTFFFIIVGLIVCLFSEASAQKKEEFKSYYRIADLPYTDNKQQRLNMLDIYMPKKGSNSPVVIWVHGGNWTSGDKRDVDNMPEFFTGLGYLFVSLNYRLAPGLIYEDQAYDIAHAIVWIYNNAIHFSGDKSKIILMGSDTGAQLTSAVALRDQYLEEKKGNRKMIRGVVSLEGVGFDIPGVLSSESNRFRDGCYAVIGNAPGRWEEASPVNMITEGIWAPPFLLAYASGKPVQESDARAMVNRLTNAIIKSRAQEYPSRSSITRELGKDGNKLTSDLLVFMSACF
ncbi:MAG: alpha/beta hydrolase [Cyclobacteriaceae bacterium]|jgi:acetyl esterase/lipase|nr:alpha/beta hydrolase [Cyclobacteriaceae bacterium]